MCSLRQVLAYVRWPASGRAVAVGSDLLGSEPCDAAALQIVSRLQQRLAESGAIVSAGAVPTDPTEPCELLLLVSVMPHGQTGISAVHSWIGWRNNRKVAEGLVEATAQESGLPALGCRVSLSSSPQTGVPYVSVSVSCPDPVDATLASVAKGLFRGISRFWADQVQSPQSEPEPEFEPEFEPESQPEPEPAPEPLLETEPESQLYPNPQPDPNPVPVHTYQQVQVIEPESVLVLSPVRARSIDHTQRLTPAQHRVPSARAPEPPMPPLPPPAVTQQPAPQPPPESQHPNRSPIIHVFSLRTPLQAYCRGRR